MHQRSWALKMSKVKLWIFNQKMPSNLVIKAGVAFEKLEALGFFMKTVRARAAENKRVLQLSDG